MQGGAYIRVEKRVTNLEGLFTEFYGMKLS